MLVAAAPQITLIVAAAMALINVWLGLRISRTRYARGVSIGHGGDPALEARMRAQANFIEYVPLALILMGLIEMRVAASPWLWAVGALLVVGRVLHPFGMDRPAPNNYRIVGMALTWVALVALIVWAILIAYRIRL